MGTNADAKVNGRAFLRLNESTLKELNVSLGFRLAVLDVIDGLHVEVSAWRFKDSFKY